MIYFDDPLDLLDDDGDGVIEMSILEEEEKSPKRSRRKNSGCCVAFSGTGLIVDFGGMVCDPGGMIRPITQRWELHCE